MNAIDGVPHPVWFLVPLWLFNIAMEHHHINNRYIIYFYGSWLP